MKYNQTLALDLLNTLFIGHSTSSINNLLIKILSKNKSRQEILNLVIKICRKSKDAKSRYIYALTYAISNKEYTSQAIFYLNLYLKNDLWEDAYKNKFQNSNQSIEERKNKHLSIMYEYLGKAYLKIYDFKNALISFEKGIDADPTDPILYGRKVECLIKQNQIDNAILYLKTVKEGRYYKKNDNYVPNSWFVDTIDKLILECENKKKNNYIYKPRKNN